MIERADRCEGQSVSEEKQVGGRLADAGARAKANYCAFDTSYFYGFLQRRSRVTTRER